MGQCCAGGWTQLEPVLGRGLGQRVDSVSAGVTERAGLTAGAPVHGALAEAASDRLAAPQHRNAAPPPRPAPTLPSLRSDSTATRYSSDGGDCPSSCVCRASNCQRHEGRSEAAHASVKPVPIQPKDPKCCPRRPHQSIFELYTACTGDTRPRVGTDSPPQRPSSCRKGGWSRSSAALPAGTPAGRLQLQHTVMQPKNDG